MFRFVGSLIFWCLCLGAVQPTGARPSESYVLVFLHKKEQAPVLAAEELKKLMEGHMANMARLASEGKLLIAGPFEGGGGIFVFRAAPREEMEAWLATDPGIQAQRWNLEVVPYHPRSGGICPVGPTYTMTTYHFLRLGAGLRKENVQQADEMAARLGSQLQKLSSRGELIAHGSLADDHDWVLVLRLEADLSQVRAQIPELYEVTPLRLYIARGSFCEK